jgi:hypothetical protein
VTDAAAERLAIPLGAARQLTEAYEHYPPIDVRVYALR